MKITWLIALLALPRLAAADSAATVNIELNDTGKQFAQDLGLDVDGFSQQVADKIRDALGLAAVDGFLRTFSDATSFSNRGMGVDYASNSERGIFGIAGNVAVATDLSGDVPAAGAAANVTLMGGLNLRRWGYPQLTVYANTFWRSGDLLESEHGSLHGSIATFGVHGQYKLFTPTSGWKRLLAQWGGIDITSGLEVAHWGLGLRGQLATSFDITNAAGDAMTTVEASTAGHFDLSSTTLTVPVEVTTNVRLFYVASLYVGLGLDAQVGSSTVDVGVSGTLTGRPTGGAPEDIGGISVNGTGSHGPSIAGYHALAGLQINLWRLKIFVQGTVEPIDRFSLALGTRVVL